MKSTMRLCMIFILPILVEAELTPEESSKLSQGVFQVLRIKTTESSHIKLLDDLYQRAEELELDFWQPPAAVGAVVDVMAEVGPPKELLLSRLEGTGLNATVIIPDVEKLTVERAEKAALREKLFPKRRDSASRAYYDFQRYHEEDEMVAYMRNVEREYPSLAQMEQIGTSHENRPIYVLKISKNDRSWGKRAIWVDGGMHAREWAAPHVAIYFIQQLVSQYGRDPEVTFLIDNLVWYIAPMTNPDGYKHSRSGSHPNVRMWRKNRSPNECTQRKCCYGVDLNRNFDFHWMETGSSSNPCSEVYAGRTAFSEPESQAIRDFVLRHSNELEGFITLHTYSQLWVHAYGHRRGEYPPDYQDLARTGRKAAKELQKLYGTKYKIGSGADALYPASGGSDDWAKDRAAIKFVYLLELRPSEEEWDGFILDERELLPTAKETWAGIKVVAAEVLRRAGKTLVSSMLTGEIPTTTLRPPPRASTSGKCEDLRYSCARWAAAGDNCLVVRAFMQEQCALSCSRRFRGFC